MESLLHINISDPETNSVMEFKAIDSGTVTTGVVGTTSLTLLNAVAVGTDYNNRIGRRINIETLNIKVFGFINTGINANPGDFYRVMVIYDKQSKGTTPSVGDILQTPDFSSPLNLNNRDRFLSLYNNTHSINAYNTMAGSIINGDPKPTIDEIYIDTSLETTYSGPNAIIGNITSGAIYLLTLTANSSINQVFNSRIRFTDY